MREGEALYVERERGHAARNVKDEQKRLHPSMSANDSLCIQPADRRNLNECCLHGHGALRWLTVTAGLQLTTSFRWPFLSLCWKGRNQSLR